MKVPICLLLLNFFFAQLHSSLEGIPQDGCPFGFMCIGQPYINNRRLPSEEQRTSCDGVCY